ncbi:MAG: hypothetical protein LBS97_01620 [Treponema sp.]|jgi:hypothetical protein|nr:hypothetical protein [Treponema sp.]
MTLQQTVTIPADRRLYLELPETFSPGIAKVVITITRIAGEGIEDEWVTAPVESQDRPAPGHRLTPRQLAAIENCAGLTEGILTSDDILESRREDLALEEAKWERLYGKEGKK